MIKLTFTINREIFQVTIENREIWYRDRRWYKGIRCIPKDEDFIKKIKMSRNRLPSFLIDLFELNEKEQAEYDNAKTDEELADIVTIDARKKGGRLLKREDGKK